LDIEVDDITGSGSYPQPPKGLQRERRLIEIQRALKKEKEPNACFEYSLQVGWKRQP